MDNGRRILVTGGTSKIGAAVAKRFLNQGDQVFVFGRDVQKGRALAAETGVQFIAGDAASTDDRARLFAEIQGNAGGLDGLVVAIGALHTARLSETTDEAWDAVMEANLVAPFLIAQACLPVLQDGGAIVFIGSGTAQWPDMELGAYSVAKRMLERMAQVLAMDVALRDIRVNVINPGEMGSPMSTAVASPLRAIPPTPIPPIGRRGDPDDVAAAVEFFLSGAAAFCTGASLTVDGGLRAALRAHGVRQ
jgi:NAD(P)-dependent dehydrogenase (short-subunit alcohol dehydrogenase family)